MDNQDKIFNKIKSAAQKAEHQDFPRMEKIWVRVEDKLEQKTLETKTKLWKKLAIVASLLLFVSLGYQFLKTDSKIVLPAETNETKMVIQKNEPNKDSIVPSENIKTKATEILQKQLEKPNPVAIIENHSISSKNDNEVILKAKAEEATIQADGIISQKPSSTLGIASMAKTVRQNLAPAAYETKEIAAMDTSSNHNNRIISGIITDESNMPIPGVNVNIKGTKNAAITDFDGKFSIEAEKGEQLIFNMIGYNSAYATVEKSNEINKKLNPTSASLDEVVVVGYGKARKNQAKNAAPIAKYGTTKFYKTEKEKSIPHIKDALYIINGVEYSEVSLFGPNPTSPYVPLSQQKIETIQVLQKEEATSKYGEKAKKGVIIITTENGIPLKR
jgi:Ca-activated chloride channel family protein